MAYADYRLCDVCKEKAFYDASLNYDFDEYPDTGLERCGAWIVLCRKCNETHEIKLMKRGERDAALAERDALRQALIRAYRAMREPHGDWHDVKCNEAMVEARRILNEESSNEA